MTYTTHTQQAIIGSSVDEQTLAQTELYHLLETQAEAIAPTQDPLTSRDRRIIGEIIEVEPASVCTIWIEGGITVWVQLVDGGRLPFDRNWFATRVVQVKATLPETPLERNERLSEELEEFLDKTLLPPTDSNAEVMEILRYKLVYVNGACPRNYRVYTDDSMIGVIFQHITHWCNGVDSLRYAEPVDAAVGLDDFMKVARVSTTATGEPPTEEELFDKEFDALTSDEWERLKKYVPTPETSDLVAA